MEMGRSRNGGGRVVTFDDAISGRCRNGSSLSSYLDMGRDADGGRTAPRPLPAHTMASRRRTYADGELDVFAAERYFRGAMDGDGDRKEGFSVTTPAVAVQAQAQPLVETAAARPTAEAVVMGKPSSTRASTVSFTASSASSANSQTALFRGGLRRRSGSSRDNKCCVQVGVLMRMCSGKRSARVDGCAAKEAPDAAEPEAATGIDWYRELRMHKAALGLGLSGDGNSHGLVAAAGLPPSLNLGTAKVAAIGREMTGEEKEAAELTFSRRRSNSTLVAPVRANNVPASGRVVGEPGGAGKVGRGGGAHHLHHDNDDEDDDDAGSESSSDLFEIKSLMIGDCPYEPSEASIQWSVVTASAADASERGDRVPARWVGGGARGPVAGRQLRGHRPAGILAGCASHRAVDVSAATTKAVPNAVAAMQQRRSEGFHKSRNGA
ncbi:protein PHYTOCHROME KINASE SUBSTRATE 2-like [Miscanthus floridulus]|uniref:protein PHYTOCHROME KINASE SUBSTRATE 2-like n=1 Tax=Miscanthus floridulus TaxID=154761 RepID=UPI003457AA5B